MDDKQPCVYILANGRNGALYVGVTSNLQKQVWQHKQAQVEGFTKRHCLYDLVYYEQTDDMYAAISREKQLKAGSRKNKLKLIESMNPEWNDLYHHIV